ncbi:MAG: hypothetical protein NZ738_10920, partial [Oceanospirillaceae bacterium]|nr:hypothetical protein [Oceanospirillaceae bacterium]
MTQALRGYSLALGTLASVLALVYAPLFLVAGLLLWGFALASFSLLARRSLVQSSILIAVGAISLGYSALEGSPAPLISLINSNTNLLAMLAAV